MVKKYLIPHAGNDYKPHVFREVSVVAMLVIVLAAFASSVVVPDLIKKFGLADIYAAAIIDNTNLDRSHNNLQSLTLNPLLSEAAQLKANDMAARNYFAHESPDGVTPWHWISQAGYSFLYAGENLAVDFNDSSAVEQAWMNSPTHRANILNYHFSEIGIGITQGFLDGKPTIFVVQMFGSPKVATASTIAATSSLKKTTTPVVARSIVSDEKLQIIASTSNFAAVRRVAGESISPSTTSSVASTVAEAPVPHYSFWYEKLFLNSSSNFRTIAWLLAGFIILALIIFIVFEWRIQHPKNILYAVMLLVIIFSMLYFQQEFVSSTLAVL